MEIKKVNLQEKLSTFSEHWTPKIVGELNGQMVKLAKVKGDFVMHQHEQEDELFYVISGTLFIELKDKTLELQPGEPAFAERSSASAGRFVIIPRGVEHKPYAPEEVCIMLFEPASTLNTGDAESELRVEKLEKI